MKITNTNKSISLILISIFLTLISCSKKMPRGAVAPSNEQIVSEEKVNKVSLLLPVEAENRRTLSEDQVKEKYRKLLTILFPAQSKGHYRSLKYADFSLHVRSKLTTESDAQTIITELEQDGIYFLVGGLPKDEGSKTRYAESNHKDLYKHSILKILEMFIQDNEENLDDLYQALTTSQLNEDGVPTDIIYSDFPVAAEDQTDIVFGLGQPMEIHGTGETIADDDTLDGIKTLTHFWDPDKGWNAGNEGIWAIMKKLLEKISDSPNMILQLIRPEYIGGLIKHPPSAFYKALCIWYGWREIEWQESEWWGSDFTQTKDVLHKGLVDYLRMGDKKTAARYLAHITHLLQDMSVPCHAHNDPHGGFGGEDMWDNEVAKKLIGNMVFRETYKLTVSESSVTAAFPYTLKYPDMHTEMAREGSFFHRVNTYYQAFSNTYGLWPLFFNTAQAAQFFPSFKLLNPLASVRGNNTFATGDESSWLLGSTPGFSGEPYNRNLNLHTRKVGTEWVQECVLDVNGQPVPDYNNPPSNCMQQWVERPAMRNIPLPFLTSDQFDTENKLIGSYKMIEILPGVPGTFYLSYQNNINENTNQIKVRFSLQDLVKCLVYKNLLPADTSPEEVHKLLEVDYVSGVKVLKLRGMPDKVPVKLGKAGLDALGIRVIEGMENPDDLEIHLLDEFGVIDGNIDWDKKFEHSRILLVFLEHPFDSMIHELLPMSTASTVRLLRNYYRWNY